MSDNYSFKRMLQEEFQEALDRILSEQGPGQGIKFSGPPAARPFGTTPTVKPRPVEILLEAFV